MNRIIVFGILVIGFVLFFSCLKHLFGKNKYIKFIDIFAFLIYLYGFLYFAFFKKNRRCCICTVSAFKVLLRGLLPSVPIFFML